MSVSIEIPVAWGDMDAYGHVNNTVFLRWCESARIAFFERIGLDRCREETGISGILASVQCRYKTPVTYPDSVKVTASLLRLGEQDFELSYEIVSQKLQRVAAQASDRLVSYDYRQLAKASWPEAVMSRIREVCAAEAES
ncbi:MAG: acyl-CoA thioesterase [Candidatus Sericytochromatia bacterium]